METSPFGKAPGQANIMVGGSKFLTRTIASKRAATLIGITSTMVNLQMVTTFFKDIQTPISRENLQYAHKLVKRLFSLGLLQNV